MGLKSYIVASVILLFAIGVYVFNIEPNDYTLQVLDQTLTLPIALWIIIPAMSLFVATLVHMFYYGFKNFLTNKSIQRDNENLILLINKRLLNENFTKIFKSNDSKEAGDILSQLEIKIKDTNFSTPNKKINETASHIININAGKYVSTRDLKLSSDNSFMQKNLKNKIDIDDNFALDVVKQKNSYSQDVIKYAFIKVAKNKSMTTIKKVLENIDLDVEMLKALVKKDSQENNDFSLDNSMLLKLIKKTDITNQDLIQIAKKYKKSISPERLIKLFEDLVAYDEKFTESYLYVLAEYEMIDNMREALTSTQKNEFTIYKAYLDLRDAGKHYPLDTFL